MRRKLPDIDTFVQGIRSANRVILGQAITLVESARADHQAMAQEIIGKLLENGPAKSFRIGITGAPGVGKSSLIETLGSHLTSQGKRVAVLAIDPTSAVSRGSILGDKTRMEHLSADPLAFIRPSPSGDNLGGVARKTRETILLVEAAGFDTVLIETVGVGQSEYAVHSMTDVFVLLLLPGAGDELQGIKRGIVEMADLLVVNKADGENLKLANQARGHYLNATHLLPAKKSEWTPKILACSAIEGTGIEALWEALQAYQDFTLKNGYFDKNRQAQAEHWLLEALNSGLKSMFYQHPTVVQQLEALKAEVLGGRVSPFAAANTILSSFGDWPKTAP